MKRILTASLMMVAGQAGAMNCEADPVLALIDAAGSDDVYVVVSGEIIHTSQPDELGKATHGRKLGTRSTAFIAGESLTHQGFSAPFAADIAIWTDCRSNDCGVIPEEGNALMFLKRDRGIFVLQPTACPSVHFANPSTDNLTRVAACFAEGECAAGPAQ